MSIADAVFQRINRWCSPAAKWENARSLVAADILAIEERLAKLESRAEPSSPAPADAGDGWRFVALGEVIEEGDECLFRFTDGRPLEWRPVKHTIGNVCEDENQFRRRVEPSAPAPECRNDNTADPGGVGPGWRSVVEGEVIRDGDEFLDYDCQWFPTKSPGRVLHPGVGVEYRRRIASADVWSRLEREVVPWEDLGELIREAVAEGRRLRDRLAEVEAERERLAKLESSLSVQSASETTAGVATDPERDSDPPGAGKLPLTAVPR